MPYSNKINFSCILITMLIKASVALSAQLNSTTTPLPLPEINTNKTADTTSKATSTETTTTKPLHISFTFTTTTTPTISKKKTNSSLIQSRSMTGNWESFHVSSFHSSSYDSRNNASVPNPPPANIPSRYESGSYNNGPPPTLNGGSQGTSFSSSNGFHSSFSEKTPAQSNNFNSFSTFQNSVGNPPQFPSSLPQSQNSGSQMPPIPQIFNMPVPNFGTLFGRKKRSPTKLRLNLEGAPLLALERKIRSATLPLTYPENPSQRLASFASSRGKPQSGGFRSRLRRSKNQAKTVHADSEKHAGRAAAAAPSKNPKTDARFGHVPAPSKSNNQAQDASAKAVASSEARTSSRQGKSKAVSKKSPTSPDGKSSNSKKVRKPSDVRKLSTPRLPNKNGKVATEIRPGVVSEKNLNDEVGNPRVQSKGARSGKRIRNYGRNVVERINALNDDFPKVSQGSQSPSKSSPIKTLAMPPSLDHLKRYEAQALPETKKYNLEKAKQKYEQEVRNILQTHSKINADTDVSKLDALRPSTSETPKIIPRTLQELQRFALESATQLYNKIFQGMQTMQRRKGDKERDFVNQEWVQTVSENSPQLQREQPQRPASFGSQHISTNSIANTPSGSIIGAVANNQPSSLPSSGNILFPSSSSSDTFGRMAVLPPQLYQPDPRPFHLIPPSFQPIQMLAGSGYAAIRPPQPVWTTHGSLASDTIPAVWTGNMFSPHLTSQLPLPPSHSPDSYYSWLLPPASPLFGVSTSTAGAIQNVLHQSNAVEPGGRSSIPSLVPETGLSISDLQKMVKILLQTKGQRSAHSPVVVSETRNDYASEEPRVLSKAAGQKEHNEVNGDTSTEITPPSKLAAYPEKTSKRSRGKRNVDSSWTRIFPERIGYPYEASMNQRQENPSLSTNGSPHELNAEETDFEHPTTNVRSPFNIFPNFNALTPKAPPHASFGAPMAYSNIGTGIPNTPSFPYSFNRLSGTNFGLAEPQHAERILSKIRASPGGAGAIAGGAVATAGGSTAVSRGVISAPSIPLQINPYILDAEGQRKDTTFFKDSVAFAGSGIALPNFPIQTNHILNPPTGTKLMNPGTGHLQNMALPSAPGFHSFNNLANPFKQSTNMEDISKALRQNNHQTAASQSIFSVGQFNSAFIRRGSSSSSFQGGDLLESSKNGEELPMATPVHVPSAFLHYENPSIMQNKNELTHSGTFGHQLNGTNTQLVHSFRQFSNSYSHLSNSYVESDGNNQYEVPVERSNFTEPGDLNSRSSSPRIQDSSHNKSEGALRGLLQSSSPVPMISDLHRDKIPVSKSPKQLELLRPMTISLALPPTPTGEKATRKIQTAHTTQTLPSLMPSLISTTPRTSSAGSTAKTANTQQLTASTIPNYTTLNQVFETSTTPRGLPKTTISSSKAVFKGSWMDSGIPLDDEYMSQILQNNPVESFTWLKVSKATVNATPAHKFRERSSEIIQFASKNKSLSALNPGMDNIFMVNGHMLKLPVNNGEHIFNFEGSVESPIQKTLPLESSAPKESTPSFNEPLSILQLALSPQSLK